MTTLHHTVPLAADGIPYGAMDCVETNVALALRLRGVPALHGLGGEWHFAFDPQAEDLGVSLERHSLGERLERMVGFTVCEYDGGATPLETIAAVIERHGVAIVFGDAYEMPWLPLFGRESLEHTFAVIGLNRKAGTVSLLDSYTNISEHGEAAPTAALVPSQTVLAAVSALRTPCSGRVIGLAPGKPAAANCVGTQLVENAAAISDEIGDRRALGSFAESYEQALHDGRRAGQFVLACWLIARKRRLHCDWLDALVHDEAFDLPASLVARYDESVATPWQRAAELAYLVGRRVRAGKQAPTTVLRMIEGELAEAELSAAAALSAVVGGVQGVAA
jgi:hypothetical protein